jgi:hypothetical protein
MICLGTKSLSHMTSGKNGMSMSISRGMLYPEIKGLAKRSERSEKS